MIDMKLRQMENIYSTCFNQFRERKKLRFDYLTILKGEYGEQKVCPHQHENYNQ